MGTLYAMCVNAVHVCMSGVGLPSEPERWRRWSCESFILSHYRMLPDNLTLLHHAGRKLAEVRVSPRPLQSDIEPDRGLSAMSWFLNLDSRLTNNIRRRM